MQQQSTQPTPASSKIFDGLFLYAGALPLFPPLVELAKLSPRPLILFSLDGGELYVNVVEGNSEDKERLRRRFWAGCVIQFFHKTSPAYSQILQHTTTLPPLSSPSDLLSSPLSPATSASIPTALLIEALVSKTSLSSSTKLKFGTLRLADGILGKEKTKDSGMRILKETDGVGVPFRMRVESRLWDLKIASEREAEDAEDSDDEDE